MSKQHSNDEYTLAMRVKLADLESDLFSGKPKLRPEYRPEYIANLMEARDFGQFSQDFDQPLARPLRTSICQLLDNIALTEAERDQWKHEAMHGGNNAYLRQRIVDLQLELAEVKKHDLEAVRVHNEAIRENNQTRFEANLNQDIFQQEVGKWLIRCFGIKMAASKPQRNHRFLEESLELVQSLGLSAQEAHVLVDYVFNRPAGEPKQEVGGVMTTLAALCFANDMNMRKCGNDELIRVTAPNVMAKVQAKQAEKPTIPDVMCEDCLDTGWLENAVEGKYACWCVAETEPYKVLLQEVKMLRKMKTRLDTLRRACGYIEDGSSCTVKIYQDDATKDWFLKSGDAATAFYSPSFWDLLDVVTVFMNLGKENEQKVPA